MMGHPIQTPVEHAGVDPGLIEVFWKGSGFDKS